MDDIDSKQTPEFHSPIEISVSELAQYETTASAHNSDLPRAATSELTIKKNSKKKINKSSSHEETAQQQEQEQLSSTDSGENLAIETSDKKALLQSGEPTAKPSSKAKKAKKKSSSHTISSNSGNGADQKITPIE